MQRCLASFLSIVMVLSEGFINRAIRVTEYATSEHFRGVIVVSVVKHALHPSLFFALILLFILAVFEGDFEWTYEFNTQRRESRARLRWIQSMDIIAHDIEVVR